MIELDTHELAWAAGFFDGEGCTILQRNKSGGSQIYIRIGQKEEDLLIRFKLAVNGYGQIYFDRHYDSRNVRINEIFRLTISKFEETQFTIAAMWKWLGPYKREQYRRSVLEHYSHKREPSDTKGARRHRRIKIIQEHRRQEALKKLNG